MFPLFPFLLLILRRQNTKLFFKIFPKIFRITEPRIVCNLRYSLLAFTQKLCGTFQSDDTYKLHWCFSGNGKLYRILNMLCDAPTNYMREPDFLKFIVNIPTVWDESITLDGKLGEYIVTARRKGNVWYIGGMTNWDVRNLKIDLSFLGERGDAAVLFKDGINAHRNGVDYKKESIELKGKK